MFFSLFCFILLFTNSIFLDTDSTTMHPVMMRETDGHHHHFNHIMMKHKLAAVPMKTGHDAMKWPQQHSKPPTGRNTHENGPTSTNSFSGRLRLFEPQVLYFSCCCFTTMMNMGPNDARRIIWAQVCHVCVFFFFSYFFRILTEDYIYAGVSNA